MDPAHASYKAPCCVLRVRIARSASPQGTRSSSIALTAFSWRGRGFSVRTGEATLAVAIAAEHAPGGDLRLRRIDGRTSTALRWTDAALPATLTAGA